MLIKELENKKILIWGLGAEGREILHFLARRGLDKNICIYNDSKIDIAAEFSQYPAYDGEAIESLLNEVDVVIKSPGVSLYKGEIIKAKEKGVKVLPSGVQYKILQEGKGAIPADSSTVKVHYEGRLIDGTVFDSSYKRNEPAVFGCKQVIKGWTEILTKMPVGSKWEVYIPQEMGYGAREAGKIPPFSALIFTVELLDIVK